MRNLKRVLSLAIAAVMLMGMMIVGASAANVSDFKDADQIGNLEAASIVTGLGVFAGDTSGNFNPKQPVTRAEMATIICKILYGANVNGDNFKGTGSFADAKTYQGGWAEGYINMCRGAGIVNGYNATTFGAGDTVTTWQAALMLQRALGYWAPAAGETISELTVTAKAANLGLYGGLTLKADADLNREDVAELVFNALFAQRVHYDDVRGLYTKDNDRNVVVNNGTDDPANTLAQNTFGLYAVDGKVMENGYTNIDLTGKTRVVFEDAADVDGNGREDAEWSFDYATGLDFIGHAATVYYRIERKAPVVYTIVDQAVKVEQTFVPSNLSTHARDKGFSRDTSDTTVIVNYNMDRVVAGDGYKGYRNGAIGDPMLLISNSSDLTVDYAIILDQELDYVTRLSVDNSDRDNPVSSYNLQVKGGLSGDANCAVTGDIAESSYVIYTEVRATPKMVVLAPAPVEQRLLTKVDRYSGVTYNLYAGGETFKESRAEVGNNLITTVTGGACTADYAVTKYADVLVDGEYNLMYDEYGRLIAVSPVEPSKAVNVAYVAQFGYKINTNPSLNDAYALTAHVYFADGSNGVYYINTKPASGNIFAGVSVDSSGKLNKDSLDSGHPMKSVEQVAKKQADTDATALNSQIKAGVGNFVRLYDVTVNSDNTVTIKELKGQNALDNDPYSVVDKGAANSNPILGTAANDGISQIKKGVTYMGNTNSDTKVVLYGNSNTVHFYVNGVYGDRTSPLTVGVATGMAKIPSITVNTTALGTANTSAEFTSAIDDGYVAQVSATQGKNSAGDLNSYATVNAILVAGYTYATAQDGVYFYDDDYTVTRVAADDYTLTYHMYDARTGEPYDMVYAGQHKSDKTAREAAQGHNTGFYKDGGKDIALWTATDIGAGSPPTYIESPNAQDQKTYVVNGIFKDYIDVGDVLTLYTVKGDGTSINNYKDGVTVDSETVFVDLSGNRVQSLEELARVIKANQDSWTNAGQSTTRTATLSYRYQASARHGDNAVDVLFIYGVVPPYSKDLTGQGTTKTSGVAVTEADDTLIVESAVALTKLQILDVIDDFFGDRDVSVEYTEDGKIAVGFAGNKKVTYNLQFNAGVVKAEPPAKNSNVPLPEKMDPVDFNVPGTAKDVFPSVTNTGGKLSMMVLTLPDAVVSWLEANATNKVEIKQTNVVFRSGNPYGITATSGVAFTDGTKGVKTNDRTASDFDGDYTMAVLVEVGSSSDITIQFTCKDTNNNTAGAPAAFTWTVKPGSSSMN